MIVGAAVAVAVAEAEAASEISLVDLKPSERDFEPEEAEIIGRDEAEEFKSDSLSVSSFL